DRGRIVTAFLTSFFERYVEYDFTASLEEKLDDISGGRLEWKKLLRQFWTDFSAAVGETKDLTITQVLDALDQHLGPHFFPETPDTAALKHGARTCPACHEGRLGLKLGKFGGFIGCSRYPECKYTRHLSMTHEEGEDAATLVEGPRLLGNDPVTGLPVTVRHGPYGVYAQLGPKEEAPPPAAEDGKKKKTKKKDDTEKPKRVSLPKGLHAHDLDLDTALKLLALPRDVGKHPETGQMITAGIGRFGPYLKHGTTWKNLTADDDVLSVGLNRAVVLLAEAKSGRGRGGSAAPGKELGKHPADGKPITVGAGRYGPYVKHGKVFASIPKDTSPDDVTLDQAVELLAKKEGKAGTAPEKKTRASGKKKK
nr:topoisomerase DNA-binding C4 zinc finger domain-containing protein [Pseudomonadota bacterium]